MSRSLPLTPEVVFRSRGLPGWKGFTLTVFSHIASVSTPDSSLRATLVFTHIPGCTWVHEGLSHRCSVSVKAHGHLGPYRESLGDSGKVNPISGVPDALQRCVKDVFAKTDASSARALAEDVASAIAGSGGIYPDDLLLDRLEIRLLEHKSNGVTLVLASQDFILSGNKIRYAGTSPSGIIIALGSNLGDRNGTIEAACRAIDGDDDMRVLRTSALYENPPMYVEDQGRFLNGVCEVRDCSLPPFRRV